MNRVDSRDLMMIIGISCWEYRGMSKWFHCVVYQELRTLWRQYWISWRDVRRH